LSERSACGENEAGYNQNKFVHQNFPSKVWRNACYENATQANLVDNTIKFSPGVASAPAEAMASSFF
jgi:hypothetical protein